MKELETVVPTTGAKKNRTAILSVAELIEGGYDKTTPVAIVVKASWPDQRIIRGTLETIADIVAKEGVLRQAMIVVSHVLDSEYELSKLYDKGFAHMYRSAKD